jgi:hypothetical protein
MGLFSTFLMAGPEAFKRPAPVTMFEQARIVFEAAVWQTYIGQEG